MSEQSSTIGQHVPASHFQYSIPQPPRRFLLRGPPTDRSQQDKSRVLLTLVEPAKVMEASYVPVNQVAPKTDVKIKTIDAAAAPNEFAREIFPSARASMASREKPPARNMAIPCAMDPQYKVHLRPIRSSVKTQTRVANYSCQSCHCSGVLAVLPYRRHYSTH